MWALPLKPTKNRNFSWEGSNQLWGYTPWFEAKPRCWDSTTVAMAHRTTQLRRCWGFLVQELGLCQDRRSRRESVRKLMVNLIDLQSNSRLNRTTSRKRENPPVPVQQQEVHPFEKRKFQTFWGSAVQHMLVVFLSLPLGAGH